MIIYIKVRKQAKLASCTQVGKSDLQVYPNFWTYVAKYQTKSYI